MALKLAHDVVVDWSSELLSQVASQNLLTQLEHINVSVQKMHKIWRMNCVVLTEFLTSFMQLEKYSLDFFSLREFSLYSSTSYTTLISAPLCNIELVV